MALHRGIDGSDPIGPDRTPVAGDHELRRDTRSSLMALGTLACPACDAPVAPGPLALSPVDPLACPYCLHGGPVRDFLSLGTPSRPARVAVRVLQRIR